MCCLKFHEKAWLEAKSCAHTRYKDGSNGWTSEISGAENQDFREDLNECNEIGPHRHIVYSVRVKDYFNEEEGYDNLHFLGKVIGRVESYNCRSYGPNTEGPRSK